MVSLIGTGKEHAARQTTDSHYGVGLPGESTKRTPKGAFKDVILPKALRNVSASTSRDKLIRGREWIRV
jgi:hypothetical protein